jgi:SAM-dependent methyltransferase
LALPLEDATIEIAAQNCLFNVFTRDHLAAALAEMHRVLVPGGRLFLSDPVATRPIPAHLADDQRLRAECLSGALPLAEYIEEIVRAGFGTIEIRRKVPYRVLDRERFGLDDHLLLESVEVCAVRDPIPSDGACVFTGRTAVYFGADETFDDGKGHLLVRDIPMAVCDKTATALAAARREDLIVTDSTWHYAGGGCC